MTPRVLQSVQPWELCCHTHGYSYNPRGAHILAHSPLQSLMNYATEAVFILLSVPQPGFLVLCLFSCVWQEEGVCTVVSMCVCVCGCTMHVLMSLFGRRRKGVELPESESVSWK